MQQENKKSPMKPIKQPKIESKYSIIDAYQILKNIYVTILIFQSDNTAIGG